MSLAILLFLAKIIVSAGMVITITLVAEKASTRFAGVLLGFPLGAGLTFFFTGVEQGAQFAASSTPWAIQGLSASLVFCLLYNLGLKIKTRGRIIDLVVPAFLGVTGFFLMAFFLLHVLAEYPSFRVAIVIVIFISTAIFFRRSPSPAIKKRVPAVVGILLGRALFAAATIICITAVASFVGPEWTGIFAAFPTTVFPTILVLHYHYGRTTVPAVFREIPLGFLAIVVFSVAVFFSFPYFGVYLGIIISYLAAFCYLLFYEAVLRSFIDNLLERR